MGSSPTLPIGAALCFHSARVAGCYQRAYQLGIGMPIGSSSLLRLPPAATIGSWPITPYSVELKRQLMLAMDFNTALATQQ